MPGKLQLLLVAGTSRRPDPGAAAAVMTRSQGAVGQRADRDGGQIQGERVPGRRGPALAARMERRSAVRYRPNSMARSRAARNASSPWAAHRAPGSASSGPSRLFPAAAVPVMNASATGPSGQNSFLRRGLRPDRPPWGGLWPAVVLIADRCLVRCNQDMLGDDLAGAGHDWPAAARPGCAALPARR